MRILPSGVEANTKLKRGIVTLVFGSAIAGILLAGSTVLVTNYVLNWIGVR